MSRSVIVLGAGIVGVCCALALQKRGLAVTLIDRREPGSETSSGNAGVLGRSGIVPLNNPGLWSLLPSYLGNRHPALNIAPGRLMKAPGWMLRFLWEARPSQAAARIAALDSLVGDTVARHAALMAEAGIAHRLRRTGTLKLWRSEAGHASARADHDLLAAHGIGSEILDRQGISGLEPGLNPIFPAGLWITDNASVDSPAAVTRAYAGLFAQRGGAIEQGDIAGLARGGAGWQVRLAGGVREAQDIVVALGPWSGDLLRPLGLAVPLDVERGYHRHFALEAGVSLSRPAFDVDGAYYMAPLEEGLRITCGVDLSGRDAPDALRQIEAVSRSAAQALPLAGQVGETWRGARPTLPDSLPMIGAAPGREGLWLAFGNQHLGLTTGPVTGEILAALLCGEAPPVDAAPFAPGRYLR